MSTSVRLILAGFALMLGAIAPAMAAPVSLTGQVTYRERMALPPNAALEVQLLDVSRADARATVHASAQLSGPGQVPLTFTLNFDDKVIDPRRSYALSARITSNGQLVFLNTTRYPVNPLAPETPILIVLDRVGEVTAQPAPPPVADDTAPINEASLPAPTLIGVTWRAVEIKGVATSEKVRTTLSIEEDGRTGGKGGCNNYFTQASFEEGRVAFAPPASTRMACPEPAMGQEGAFFSALPLVAAFAIEGEMLTLRDGNGNPVLRLVKDR